jgi:hypothetical protein
MREDFSLDKEISSSAVVSRLLEGFWAKHAIYFIPTGKE